MTDDLEIDELLGESRKEEPRPAKTRKSVSTPGRADAAVVQALFQPVSITFLAEVLQKDRKTVTKRLSELPPVAQHRGNIPLYDFRQAIGYLVAPRVDARKIEDVLRKMGPGALPPTLSKDIWDAKLKQQKWEENAGDLWRTADILEVLGEAFQRLKTTTQLWVDQLDDTHALPAPVRRDLIDLVDGLQVDLHRTLVEMPKERQTRSQMSEIDGMVSDE